MYENWIRTERPDLMKRLTELKGKTLGCWCKPNPCHGDVLVRLVNELSDEHEFIQTHEKSDLMTIDTKVIKFFKAYDKFEFLSNFYPATFIDD